MKTFISSLAIALVLAACGAIDHPADSRAPEAVGTVTAVSIDDAVGLTFDPDPGFEYYEGTVFIITDDAAVVDEHGTVMDPADISIGARIEVWHDACAESFPVQCANPQVRVHAD